MCVGETQADGRVNCVRGTGGKSLEAKDPGEGDLLAWPWPWPWPGVGGCPQLPDVVELRTRLRASAWLWLMGCRTRELARMRGLYTCGDSL